MHCELCTEHNLNLDTFVYSVCNKEIINIFSVHLTNWLSDFWVALYMDKRTLYMGYTIFDVLMAVTMKVTTFLDVMSCGRCFPTFRRNIAPQVFHSENSSEMLINLYHTIAQCYIPVTSSMSMKYIYIMAAVTRITNLVLLLENLQSGGSITLK